MLFHRRVIKGLLVAAITPVAVILVIALGCAGVTSNTLVFMAGFTLVMTSAGKGPAMVMATLLIGIAGYYAAMRLRRFSLLFYVTGGAAISMLVTALLALDLSKVPVHSDLQHLHNVLTLATSLITGPLAAAAFWAIARPDRINFQATSQPEP